jgi:hypothetical protein
LQAIGRRIYFSFRDGKQWRILSKDMASFHLIVKDQSVIFKKDCNIARVKAKREVRK